jgi:EAL domain-containing protein (putative c-di-GMP-specific phosphodiesterase class I)
VLRAADAACYVAKEQGRNCVRVHRQDDEIRAVRYLGTQWAAEINLAIETGRFRLYCEPIIGLQEETPRGAKLVELVVRMTDRDGHLVPPARLLSAIERYDLSVRLDRWIIRTLFGWANQHPRWAERLSMCGINLSRAGLADPGLLTLIEQECARASLAPDKLCFEVAELAAIADLSTTLSFTKRLTGIGCRVALDHFGSSLSSFAYLRHMPVDFVKIDGLLVKGIEKRDIDLALVRSINEIGHVIGLRTIAGSVDSAEQLHKITEIGVDFAQGEAVGAARPIDEALYPTRSSTSPPSA